jgi:hypothetical protein
LNRYAKGEASIRGKIISEGILIFIGKTSQASTYILKLPEIGTITLDFVGYPSGITEVTHSRRKDILYLHIKSG